MLKALKVLFFGSVLQPTNHAQVVLSGVDPDGFQLLYAAPNIPEADMLRQVLAEAGFHMEFFPAANTGVFGISGNQNIYVRNEEFDEAAEFLREYLSAEPLMEDEAEQE